MEKNNIIELKFKKKISGSIGNNPINNIEFFSILKFLPKPLFLIGFKNLKNINMKYLLNIEMKIKCK